ncbi:MAG: VIT1/CCC1 transporter family protein [Anaerolineales bacterium]
MGAEPGAKVMLILGSANQFGEGFSMATGAYLSSKSQREYCDREQAHEKGELDQFPGGTPGGVRLPMRPTLQ